MTRASLRRPTRGGAEPSLRLACSVRSITDEHLAHCELLGECILDELFLLCRVLGHVTDRGRRRHRPPRIRNGPRRGCVGPQVCAQAIPGALVLRLFLTPHELLRIREL